MCVEEREQRRATYFGIMPSFLQPVEDIRAVVVVVRFIYVGRSYGAS